MAEKVILVDEENRELGTTLKSEVHGADTPLHRAFSVFLFNKKGEVLLQQRAAHKKTWPKIWSNSCCGHVSPGETTEKAAKRRLRQELGLRVTRLHKILPKFRYRVELDGVVENEICPVFVGFVETDPKANAAEVMDWKWVSWPEFKKEILSDKNSYSPWAKLEVQEMVESKEFNQIVR